MKIHMRNIVAGAISRGLIDGYLATKKQLQETTSEKQEIHLLEQIQSQIWDELDDIVDFTDDENDIPPKAPVGFNPSVESVTDAVSGTMLPEDLDDETTEEDRHRAFKRRFIRKQRRS